MSTQRVQIVASEPKYKSTRVWVGPYFDEVTQEFIVGGKRYQAETPKLPSKEYSYISNKAPLVLTDTFMRQIQDGDAFDPNDEKSMFIVQMALDRGVLAKNRSEVNESQHVFYLKDEQREAVDRSTKADKIFAAMGIVRKMSLKDKTELCFFQGQPARTMSEEMVDAYVKDLAVSDPGMVIGLSKSDNWKVRAFIRRAVVYGVLTQEGPLYKLGTVVIGIDEDAAVAYMLDKANIDTVKQLKARIEDEQADEAELPKDK